jgi:hypothetical protein
MKLTYVQKATNPSSRNQDYYHPMLVQTGPNYQITIIRGVYYLRLCDVSGIYYPWVIVKRVKQQ